MTKTALANISSSVEFAPMLTGSQIRAARALLKWSGQDLAEQSGVSYPAIQRAERVDDMPNMQAEKWMAKCSSFRLTGKRAAARV